MRLDFLARRTFGACGGSTAEAGQGHAAGQGHVPSLGRSSAAGLIRAASRSGVPSRKAQYSAIRSCQRARATRHGAMVLMAGLAAIMNAGIASACSGRLSGVTGIDAAYAPFEAMNASKEFSITVQNTGATECVFWLGGWRVATVAEAAALNFELRGRDGTLPSAGAATPTAPAWLGSRRLAPNESHDFALVLAIPAGQVLPPGDYATHSRRCCTRARMRGRRKASSRSRRAV